MITNEQREELESLIAGYTEAERALTKAKGKPAEEGERDKLANRAWTRLQQHLDSITE